MTTEPLAPSPITFGRVVRYATLPAVVPRLRTLLGTGFGSFAFFIALVFRAVRLMPDGHPYLNPLNINRFGTAAVILEAWRHIRFNRKTLGQKNLDQMVVFGLVLAAIGLLVFQLAMVGMAVLFPQAQAFSFPGGASFPTFFHMFDTPQVDPSILPYLGPMKITQSHYDLSFIFLDRVFGIPDIFNSCIADQIANTCLPAGELYGASAAVNGQIRVNDPAMFPWPYHVALHGMFQFYSVGLLVVAVFLLIYYTIVVVAETAQTGTPFGKRFNTLWAPLRLVMAAGLLIPISYGLNAGQYVVLYSAKWGANFASNGWIGFNQTLALGPNATPLGDKNSLLARPGRPDPGQLLHFISVMHACKTVEDKILQPREAALYKDEAFLVVTPQKIKPYLVRQSGTSVDKNIYLELTETLSYDEAVKWSKLGDVTIRFGIQDADRYKSKRGTVEAFCGELVVPTVVVPWQAVDSPTPQLVNANVGAQHVMGAYWDLLKTLIFKRDAGQTYQGVMAYSGGGSPESYGSSSGLNWNINQKISEYYVDMYLHNAYMDAGAPMPSDLKDVLDYMNGALETAIKSAQKFEQERAANTNTVPADLLVRGWAGAGIWYNRIAEMNGVFTAAVFNLPKISEYPLTMKFLAKTKQTAQLSTSPKDVFDPHVDNQKFAIVFERGGDEARAADAYWHITNFWQQTGMNTSTRGAGTGNVILDLMNFMFGTSGLFSIRENANVHPLAQLSSIGKSLIERSVTLLGVGLAGTAVQPWIPESLAGMRAALGVISGFAFSVLSIGAAAGFIMYYIIPLLPFIYFFFAVAGWVKAIFEAMVGVPLWALAHIRISGDGLPGDAAMQGYFLILEIMVRPILIVFGLIASVSIYAASVHVLNDIFNLAVANVGGVDMDAVMNNPAVNAENLRGSVDTFFYTIMYAILVYMLGMSCFKLIDLIPGSMLRWLGSNAQAFTDSGEASANQLVGYGTIGSQMIFNQLGNAAKGGVSGLSDMAKALKDQGTKPS
jgi:conjugal transfer/type IV secretion protein DotA/TraY